MSTFDGFWMTPDGSVPARLVAGNGQVALLIAGQSPTGFVDVFRVPVQHARVSSAAQRITVTVGSTAYSVLARPHGPIIGAALGAAGAVAGLAGAHVVRGGSTVARGGNLAADAAAFSRQGGHQFLAALRHEGAPARRVGYPALLVGGFAIGLLVVALITIVTVAALA